VLKVFTLGDEAGLCGNRYRVAAMFIAFKKGGEFADLGTAIPHTAIITLPLECREGLFAQQCHELLNRQLCLSQY